MVKMFVHNTFETLPDVAVNCFIEAWLVPKVKMSVQVLAAGAGGAHRPMGYSPEVESPKPPMHKDFGIRRKVRRQCYCTNLAYAMAKCWPKPAE